MCPHSPWSTPPWLWYTRLGEPEKTAVLPVVELLRKLGGWRER